MKNKFYNVVLALGMVFTIWNILWTLWSRGPGRGIGSPAPPMTATDWKDFYVRASILSILGIFLLQSNTKNITNIAGFLILSIIWVFGSFVASLHLSFYCGNVSFYSIPLGVLLLSYFFIYPM